MFFNFYIVPSKTNLVMEKQNIFCTFTVIQGKYLFLVFSSLSSDQGETMFLLHVLLFIQQNDRQHLQIFTELPSTIIYHINNAPLAAVINKVLRL